MSRITCVHTDVHLNEALRGTFHLLQKRFHKRCGGLFSLVRWVMSWGRPGDEGGTGLACMGLNTCFCVVFIHTRCCSTMELKATSVLILVCFAIVILTSNEVDAIPSCCLTLTKKFSKRMLRSVSRYKIQRRSGGCDIDALVLFTKKKIICADLSVLKELEKLKNNHKLKQTKAKTG